jgi:hypothetical protein
MTTGLEFGISIVSSWLERQKVVRLAQAADETIPSGPRPS